MFTHSRFTPICLALGVALSSGSSCVYAQSTNTVTLTDAISRLSAQYKVVILTTIADSDSVKVPPVTASVTIELHFRVVAGHRLGAPPPSKIFTHFPG